MSNNRKCSAKNVCLTLFFFFQVLAFTACLLAIVSPTWQFVYLEDGRTEHHHGLWMDCKRDYSNEYGLPREYYEKLYRLDDSLTPFSQFSLPKLMCVYKFDYWIDEEDLYEHGYDENRLQGDGYQHLFLGWKIAALTALTFSLVCSLSSLIICIFAFCHKVLVCVSTVVDIIAVTTAIIGNAIFFMYARYQDNNIIKEDDGLYEQYFGWAFYTSLIGNGLLFIASVFGCVATPMALSGRAKLVKIEVEDNDSHQLLSSNSSDQPFKRSFSAVYKIDSVALRKWEKEAMKSFRKNEFKRANSMPNIKKGQMRNGKASSIMHSTSDISKAFTEPAHFVTTQVNRHSVSEVEQRISDQYASLMPAHGGAYPANDSVYPPPPMPAEEVVYEYVDHNSISLSSVKLDTLQKRDLPQDKTTLNVYDKVPSSTGSGSISGVSQNQYMHVNDDNEYLRPKNVQQSTTISAVANYDRPAEAATSFGTHFGHRRMPSEDFRASPVKPPTSTFKSSLKPLPPEIPAKPTFLQKNDSVGIRLASDNDSIAINTFDNNRKTGSLAMFSRHQENPPVSVFDRSTTASPNSVSSDLYSTNRAAPKLFHQVLLNEAVNAGIKETSLDWPSLPRSDSRKNSDLSLSSKTGSLNSRYYAPSEMDRSVGSSTLVLPQSPSQRIYDLDSEDDASSKTSSTRNQKDGETFV